MLYLKVSREFNYSKNNLLLLGSIIQVSSIQVEASAFFGWRFFLSLLFSSEVGT
jgi:hypothetical protein